MLEEEAEGIPKSPSSQQGGVGNGLGVSGGQGWGQEFLRAEKMQGSTVNLLPSHPLERSKVKGVGLKPERRMGVERTHGDMICGKHESPKGSFHSDHTNFVIWTLFLLWIGNTQIFLF